MKIFIFVVIVFIPALSYAHPESGFLPDAIAEMEYKIVLDINPKDIETRNKLGVVLYRKDKLSEAEKEFLKVLEMSPKDFDAYDGMGLVRMKQKKYKEAVNWFKKAIEILEEDTMVHYHLGSAYEQMGNFDDAMKAYKKALAVNSMLIEKGINIDLEATKKSTVMSALRNVEEKIRKMRK